ncbi:MAG: FAD-binding protein, partial [Planctomycetes bacterium]|nr:FAD-binding protein [Planctomycetota bacterium]
EFLLPYFDSPADMHSMVFLKGYQWPFDPAKAVGGSSLIDILVYIETVIKGRRVFMDFRSNADGYELDKLSKEAAEYLRNSKAFQDTPIERLEFMNPGAVELYKGNGIDIHTEPLEIAVCAQHNNGGLAGNHWWESLNVKHLFPVGEVNGSHGVYRPGGSALNSGQVGGFRAADYIANCYLQPTLDAGDAEREAQRIAEQILVYLAADGAGAKSWPDERAEFQERMTRAAAHIRSKELLAGAVTEAREQYARLCAGAAGGMSPRDQIETLRNRQLCYAHLVYLEAIKYAVDSGVGSRGSALVQDSGGQKIHKMLDDTWRFAGENPQFKEKVLETLATGDTITSQWVPRREIPESDEWFETAWAAFRQGEIYK